MQETLHALAWKQKIYEQNLNKLKTKKKKKACIQFHPICGD